MPRGAGTGADVGLRAGIIASRLVWFFLGTVNGLAAPYHGQVSAAGWGEWPCPPVQVKGDGPPHPHLRGRRAGPRRPPLPFPSLLWLSWGWNLPWFLCTLGLLHRSWLPVSLPPSLSDILKSARAMQLYNWQLKSSRQFQENRGFASRERESYELIGG